MAWTVATFKTAYPEFIDAPAGLVQAKLDDAAQLVNPTVWGGDATRDLTDQGVGLYAAHFLALSPYARNMALVNDKGTTLYEGRLDALKRIVASGYRVL